MPGLPSAQLLLSLVVLALACPLQAAIDVERLLKNVKEGLQRSGSGSGNPIRDAGDALVPREWKRIGGLLTDTINSVVGNSGEVTVEGRRFQYRYWGGLKGLRGWFWYGQVTDVATGMSAGSGGPDHRCRSRQCTVEEGVKKPVRMLEETGKL